MPHPHLTDKTAFQRTEGEPQGKKNAGLAKAELEKILSGCEQELLEMALVEARGGNAGAPFKTPVFRYLWLKLTEPLRRQAEFYKKGIGY